MKKYTILCLVVSLCDDTLQVLIMTRKVSATPKTIVI